MFLDECLRSCVLFYAYEEDTLYASYPNTYFLPIVKTFNRRLKYRYMVPIEKITVLVTQYFLKRHPIYRTLFLVAETAVVNCIYTAYVGCSRYSYEVINHQ